MSQPKQPSQNNSKTDLSRLDSGQIIQDVHIPKDNALKTIDANCLVPNEFTHIDLVYVTSGNGVGEIEIATYSDTGCKQTSSFTARTGSSETTLLNFNRLLADNLNQKHFLLYDSNGSVGVYFSVDDDSTVPTTGALRDIEISIQSNLSTSQIAKKTADTLDFDLDFIAVSSGVVAITTSAQIGNKTNASDVNTGISITTKDGVSASVLNNTYFKIYRPKTILETSGGFHHVWFNVGGAGVDPVPASTLGGIEVAINLDETESGVRQKTAESIDSSPYFTSIENDNRDKILVTCNIPGLVSDTEDVNTGFKFFSTEKSGKDKKIVRTVMITYNSDNEIDEVQSF